MKIAIVGTGSMGAVYAARLSDSGNPENAPGNTVWAIDVWDDHVNAINANGLRVEGPDGDKTYKNLKASTKLEDAGPCDLYVIATKASGVGPAAQAISKVARDNSMILTIQNGLGAGERIAQHMPTENVLLGVAEGFGASLKGPGHAHHNAMKRIRLGELKGGSSERLNKLEALWADAGFNVQAYEDIEQLVWEKFLCNVTFSSGCTLFKRTIGEVMNDPASWTIALGCMNEAYECGKAKKVNFSFQNAVEMVTQFGEAMPKAKPSMLLDHEAGRPSEIDAIVGMVPVLGAELGIATPFATAATAAIKAREASFS